MDQYAIGAPDWVIPTAVIGGVLFAVVLWAYVRAPASPWTRYFALALKLVAIAAIALCLLEPLRRATRPRPQANVVAVLLDNSQSMLVGSGADAESRRERLVQKLRRQSPWRERLEQDFDVRTYAFDSRLFGAAEYAALAFDGHASSLFQSLETVGSRYRDRPVAGLLLISDGNATDVSTGAPEWGEIGFPIYPVLDDSEADLRDVAIESVGVNQSDFEAAPVTMQVDVTSAGLSGEKLVAQLVDEKGDLVEEQIVPLRQDGTPAGVHFRFRPEESGVRFYRVQVFPESQREAFGEGRSGAEVTLANNSRLVTVQGRRGPYRVLYLAGRPNWEFKFVRRSLDEDAEIELVGLVRMARKEPKFSFRDFETDDTNPLFRGFSEDEEETAEQYDEPVLLRFGIDEGTELKAGFPKTADDLFGYHAVVLDDIEAEYFSQDQMLLLRRFVSARGGGLLMLGGPDSFAKGGYEKTPLGEMAPVYIDAAARESVPEGPLKLELTREGWLEPWMRLRDTEVAEKDRLNSMPGFRTLSRVGHLKAGASVLATVEGPDGTSAPALVVQRFGKGRSAALLIGDMWRWAMRREDKDSQDLQQTWRQLVRWIVSDVPRRVELDVDQPDDPAQPVELNVTVRDPEYLPLDNATVELEIVSPGGKEFKLTAEPSAGEAGVYSTSYWPRDEGGYRVEAVVRGPDGSRLPTAEAGWTAQPAAGEYKSLQPNRALLDDLADRTGGEIVHLDALDDFVTSLPNRQIPVTETWVYPVWHQPWVLTFAIACLCAEWGLRRWRGLP